MKRKINGILLLDKPLGITSNEALQLVKKLFKAEKAGHTGSLDPIATGMLPICFGEATKFSQFLLEANKHYIATGKLGETTDTADSEGKIIEKRQVIDINKQKIEEILPKFRGKILQLPPMYSAIKHNGQPLYKLARQGIEIKRRAREISIHKLHLLEVNEDIATFEIKCSKGTYVRTIVEDIGKILGCGAHVIALRRLSTEPYDSSQMVTLQELQNLAATNTYQALDKFLLPINSMLLNIPEIALAPDMIHYIYSGQSLFLPNIPSCSYIKIMDKNNNFIGVGETTSDGKMIPRKICRKN